jgi:hypothetical protein
MRCEITRDGNVFIGEIPMNQGENTLLLAVILSTMPHSLIMTIAKFYRAPIFKISKRESNS